MLKKNLILSLLIFAYTIVLGHSAIPHEHFDDLFTSDQHQDSHKNNNNNHHSPFSHSIILHVVIDEQTAFTAHSVLNLIKKTLSNNLYCIPVVVQPLLGTSFLSLLFNCCTLTPEQLCSTSISNRGPPVLLAYLNAL